jgi:hypothetical protein
MLAANRRIQHRLQTFIDVSLFGSCRVWRQPHQDMYRDPGAALGAAHATPYVKLGHFLPFRLFDWLLHLADDSPLI